MPKCVRELIPMITGESVEQARCQVAEYSDETLAVEFERFFREQPAICDFVVEVTRDSNQHIQELALFLSYMVFKTLEIGEPGFAKTVTPERIEAAFHESESWITMISEA